jgi:hypothetical protein
MSLRNKPANYITIEQTPRTFKNQPLNHITIQQRTVNGSHRKSIELRNHAPGVYNQKEPSAQKKKLHQDSEPALRTIKKLNHEMSPNQLSETKTKTKQARYQGKLQPGSRTTSSQKNQKPKPNQAKQSSESVPNEGLRRGKMNAQLLLLPAYKNQETFS